MSEFSDAQMRRRTEEIKFGVLCSFKFTTDEQACNWKCTFTRMIISDSFSSSIQIPCTIKGCQSMAGS